MPLWSCDSSASVLILLELSCLVDRRVHLEAEAQNVQRELLNWASPLMSPRAVRVMRHHITSTRQLDHEDVEMSTLCVKHALLAFILSILLSFSQLVHDFLRDTLASREVERSRI